MSLTHFTSLDHLTAQEFSDLLDVAVYLKRRRMAGIPERALAGKTLVMIFEKPSLRTRLSFEVGMTELGGVATYIRGEEVGLGGARLRERGLRRERGVEALALGVEALQHGKPLGDAFDVVGLGDHGGWRRVCAIIAQTAQ